MCYRNLRFFVSEFVEQFYNAIIKFVALAKAFLSVALKNNPAGATFILNQIEPPRCWKHRDDSNHVRKDTSEMTTSSIHSPTSKIELTLSPSSDGDILAALQPYLDLGMSLPSALKAVIRVGMVKTEILNMAIRSGGQGGNIDAYNAAIDEYNAEIDGHNDVVDKWFGDEAEAV